MATCKRLSIAELEKAWGGNRAIVYTDDDTEAGAWPTADTPMTLRDVVRLINAANGYDEEDRHG